MTNYKEWAKLDFDSIEPGEVTPFDKKKVKKHMLKRNKRKKLPIWRNTAAAIILLLGKTITMRVAFPSVAS